MKVGLKAKIIGIGLVLVLVASVTAAIIFVKPIDLTPQKKENDFKDWNRSGPFAINKKEYKIGENIFFVADGLAPGDSGNIVFHFPNVTRVYFPLPFDGEKKSSFNYYFKPALSKAKHICSTDELIGEWTIFFEGTQYKPLKFRILNETDPSQIGSFKRIC